MVPVAEPVSLPVVNEVSVGVEVALPPTDAEALNDASPVGVAVTAADLDDVDAAVTDADSDEDGDALPVAELDGVPVVDDDGVLVGADDEDAPTDRLALGATLGDDVTVSVRRSLRVDNAVALTDRVAVKEVVLTEDGMDELVAVADGESALKGEADCDAGTEGEA